MTAMRSRMPDSLFGSVEASDFISAAAGAGEVTAAGVAFGAPAVGAARGVEGAEAEAEAGEGDEG
jgi:hypothetical protein